MYLAGSNANSIIGNFIADHVKGDDTLMFNHAIREGIKMHRSIDSYTDSHPVVRQSIMRLRPANRKYAGVVVDMFYDHFLSSQWHLYSTIPLEEFTASRFHILMEHYEKFPSRAKYLLHFMMKDNWIKGYGTIEGLNRALTGMSKRTPFASGMEVATNDLLEYYNQFENEFRTFFPEMVSYVVNKFNSLIEYRCDNFPQPTVVSEFAKIDPLPGTKVEFRTGDRNCNG